MKNQKDIEEGIQKEKKKIKNKKIINQIKIISSLENKVQKRKKN